MSPARSLLIFLKAPVPGKVKTRLGKDLGAAAATEAYVEMARVIRDEVKKLSGVQVQWVYAGDPEFPDLGWLDMPEEPFWKQTNGDLGRRLKEAFERAFRAFEGAISVIGMDSPGLPAERMKEAFAALAGHDLAVGPTEDGGYYLLGLAKPEPRIFAGIPWSSATVFEKTIERAKELELRTKVLPEYFDVDTLAEYQRWKKSRATGKGGASPSL